MKHKRLWTALVLTLAAVIPAAAQNPESLEKHLGEHRPDNGSSLRPQAPAVERTAASVETGREVLGRMVRALGGERAGATRAVRRSGQVVLSTGGRSMAVSQTTLVVFPDRIYSSMQTPMGEQVAVIDGGEGFVSAGGRVQPLPADRVERQLADLGRDLAFLVRHHEHLVAVAGGEEEVDGTACTLLAVSFEESESRLCVSAEGLVLRQTYEGTHPFTGAPGQFEVVYSDYREVGDRRVPHRRTTRIDGADFSSGILGSYEVDPEVDPALFERPGA